MRLNLKASLMFLTIVVVIITCAVYMRCTDFSFTHDLVRHWDRRLYAVSSNDQLLSNGVNEASSVSPNDNHPLQDIECIVNHEYTVQCKHDETDHEVYIPFTFLRQYFDISGSLSLSASPVANSDSNMDLYDHNNSPNHLKFLWMHTNAKINLPKGKYNPHGRFMYFENYNVEVRDRVKCISAADGVPVSIQWEKRGYFYPTQIAQFALAHYSKNLSEAKPRLKILEDGEERQSNWFIPQDSSLERIWNSAYNTGIVQYETPNDYSKAINLDISNQTSNELLISSDLMFLTNGSSFMIHVENREWKRSYILHYIPSDLLLSVQDANIYYGMGVKVLQKWHHLTRDVHIDIQKGLNVDSPKKAAIKVKRSDLRIVSISFMGAGFYDNLTMATADHLAHFYDAAKWFVNNQDKETGGWPNPVRRNLNGFAELKAGWLSAMGQGHAISVLARAYWHSGGDKRYLKAAAKALKPYRVLAKDGGVLAKFLDKFYWYEEYPTTPPSFVLNGFIYSLLGLYDLNCTAPLPIADEAGKLFHQGMTSLKKMLPLYDTGSGTSYDLRHLSLGVAPNLARWDYHATHVNQLLLLATIDNDPLIEKTAERWKGYMFGRRAKHN